MAHAPFLQEKGTGVVVRERLFPESPSSDSAPRAEAGRILRARETARQTASPLERAIPFGSQTPRVGGRAGWCVCVCVCVCACMRVHVRPLSPSREEGCGTWRVGTGEERQVTGDRGSGGTSGKEFHSEACLGALPWDEHTCVCVGGGGEVAGQGGRRSQNDLI